MVIKIICRYIIKSKHKHLLYVEYSYLFFTNFPIPNRLLKECLFLPNVAKFIFVFLFGFY